jgi:hypothetical protein
MLKQVHDCLDDVDDGQNDVCNGLNDAGYALANVEEALDY